MKTKVMLYVMIALLVGIVLAFSYQLAQAAPAMGQLKIVRVLPDGAPASSSGIAPATWTDAIVLAANTPATYNPPPGAVFALITCNGNVYVTFGTTVSAVPASSITNGSAPTLNPSLRNINGITTMGFISASIAICTIDLWNQ